MESSLPIGDNLDLPSGEYRALSKRLKRMPCTAIRAAPFDQKQAIATGYNYMRARGDDA